MPERPNPEGVMVERPSTGRSRSGTSGPTSVYASLSTRKDVCVRTKDARVRLKDAMAQGTGSKLSTWIDRAALVDRLGEGFPGLLYVFDLATGQNVYANRSVADMLGLSPDEMRSLGPRLLETVVHPDDMPRVIEYHARLTDEHRKGELVEIEYRVRSPDRGWRWLHSWEVVLSRDPESPETYLFGVAQDVTSRVQVEEALRESERRLAESEQRWRSIAENPFDFVVVIDRDFKYTFVNFVAPGLRMEDLVGKATPFDFVAPECHQTMREAFDAVFEHGRPGAYDVYVPALDAWYASLVGPIRDGDRVTHASILTREITDQRRLEAQARRAERRFRIAIEGAQDVLFDRDLTTNEIFVSPRLDSLLGVASAGAELDLFGASFGKWLHPDDRDRVLAAYDATLSGGAPFNQEFRLRTAHDDYVWFDARGRVVREQGEHDHFAGFLADSTERKARERELERQKLELTRALETQKRLEAKLAQVAKLEAVGRLAGGIAHDFNNLLTGIHGLAEDMRARTAAGDPNAADIEDLRHVVKRGAALTRQLLTFSRKKEASQRVVDLTRLLGDAARIVRRLLGSDIDIVVASVPGLWSVHGDPHQLEQVLINLAINSRDAMPEGGRLEIDAMNVELDPAFALEHPEARSGQFVELRVTDTGSGMSADTLPHIFEPFFTTKPVGVGTGLGLSTVYGIVRQAEGFVLVRSEPGQGTSFHVYLPKAEGAAHESTLPPATSPAGNETILVVEDEALLLRLCRHALEDLGYKVEASGRGDEAFERIESGLHFDLLVTDLVLPGLSGMELYRRAKRARSDLRAVFLSGYADSAFGAGDSLPPGASFLQKPFAIAELAATVRRALDT